MKKLFLIVTFLLCMIKYASSGQGWYLIAPPVEYMTPADNETTIVRSDKPFSTWQIWRVFDTAKECDAIMTKMISDANLLKDSKNKKDQKKHLIRLSAVCIASDDPRLKP